MTDLDPYARQMFRGVLLDNATISAARDMERELGYQLTLIQGVGGATASAGTHLGKDGIGGRAIDVAPWDIDNKLECAFDHGFFGWSRDELPGVWGPHGHLGLMFVSRTNTKGMADSLARQRISWDNKRDGLVSNHPDPTPRPAKPVVYSMADFRKEVEEVHSTNVTKMRDRLVETHYDLGKAIAFAKAVPPARVVVKAQIDDLRKMRAEVTDMLIHLPKR